MKGFFSLCKELLKKYGTYIKIAISVIILYVIFSKIDARATFALFLQLRWYILLLVLVITVVKFFSQVVTWRLCLEVFNLAEFPFKKVVRTHFIGLALRFFLPGGYATFGKAVYFPREDSKSTLLSVLLEKFFGIWVIIFFLSVTYMMNPVMSVTLEGNVAPPSTLAFAGRLLLHICGVLVILFPFILILIVRRFVGQQIIERYITALPLVLLAQMVYILLTATQYYVLLRVFTDLDLNFLKVSLPVAMILCANIIPITYSGLGLREAAAALFLPKLGVLPEVAVGVSLIIFFLNSVLPALPGVYYIVRKNWE